VFSTADTIVAVATPTGRGGIGVVRVSGPEAAPIARRLVTCAGPLQPRYATLTFARARRPIEVRSDAAVSRSLTDASAETGSADVQPGAVERRTVPRGAAAPAAERCAGDRESDGRTRLVDQVIVTYFPAPASYTGDDVVELSAHGSPVVLRMLVEAAVDAGARLAQPGEFTLRAYLNGRIDLVQAEAVADLVDAVTPLQARAAFDQLQGTLTSAILEIDRALFDLIARLEASIDFPEEGYHFVDAGTLSHSIAGLRRRVAAILKTARRGRLVREGLQIAIVGKPNVGKSSLFNALVGSARSIVTDVPGTTRDLVSETIDLEGLRVTLVDTAGLGAPLDAIEAEGVARAHGAASVADLVMVVVDGSIAVDEDELDALSRRIGGKTLIVSNKADLGQLPLQADHVCVSARTGQGLDDLRSRIGVAVDADPRGDAPAISNVRQIALLDRVDAALSRAERAAGGRGDPMPEEFVLADLQEARLALEEVTGVRASGALLEHIFSNFCIGK
jgi:tRNA modification GTPase